MLGFFVRCGAAAVAAVAVWNAPSIALACGGCFAPTGEPSVVTAHRMVVAMNATETTLWDQFEYSGDPADFVWVLPIASHDGVDIQLADQAFFLYLAESTKVTLQAPFAPSTGGGGGCGFGCGDSDSASADLAPMMSPVEIYERGVVGPYETLVLGSDSGSSLVDWLQDNGYSIPDSLVPTVMHYVDADMDFVVLRLTPNAGASQIQPVRVTTPGISTTFPLRMVSAGVVESVQLELYTIAEGRVEAQNFPNTQINEGDLVFDWSDQTFNYDVVRAEALTRDGGRMWLTEFSDRVQGDDLTIATFSDDNGELHSATADWEVATRNLRGTPWITRMRADLPLSALEVDLELQASTRPARPGFYMVTNEVNRPEGTAPIAGRRIPPIFFFLVPAALLFVSRRYFKRPVHRTA
jgi:hypothetical protein